MDLRQLRDDVVVIARQAGRRVLDFTETRIPHAVTVKSSIGDLATELDESLEREISDRLRALMPDAQVIGEETGQHGTGRLTWVVDPIDGSTNLAHSIPHAAVSVALCEGLVPLVGVVHNPFADRSYTAITGQGAFAWPGETATPRPMRVSGVESLSRSLLSFGLPYDKSRTEAITTSVGRAFRECQDLRRRGSAALDICSIADGQTEAHFEFDLRPWDVAAAGLILTESGGRLSTWQGGDVGWKSPGDRIDLVASNTHIHEELLSVL